MKVVFFGASKFVLPILEVLRKNFDLALVVTTEKLPTESVPSFCKKYSIPYVSVTNLSDKSVKSQLLEVRSQLAVLAYFGLILPKDVLDLFPKGILNTHPSLLPRYRGPTPGQTAILNGDQITGVTIIKLDEEVDHGPILAQEKVNILPTDTNESLYSRLFEKGARMLSSIVQTIELNKPLREVQQEHGKATFTEHLTRQSGYFDSNNPPSPETLDRMIRAYYPWPGVWARLKLNNVERVIKFLPKQKLQVEGKKPMTYKDFLNGYPELKEKILQILPVSNNS